MFSFNSKKRKPGWMAVTLNGDSITLVYVLRDKNAKPAVRLFESFACEGAEAAALQRLVVSRRLNSYVCTTVMPKNGYTTTVLDAPPVPAEERKEALRWQLKDVVNYPLDSACVDVLDIPRGDLPGERPPSVIVISAAEKDVRELASRFESAKLNLNTIDIPEIALRNAAVLMEEENRGLAFLFINETGTQLILTFQGELIAERHRDVNTVQLNSKDVGVGQSASEHLFLEVQRSLDNFDRQYRHISISKLVVAVSPPVENLVADLTQNTSVPAQEMDLSPFMDFSAIPELSDPAMQARHLLAIGAALRTGEACV